MWCAGRTAVTCNGLYVAQIGVIMELPIVVVPDRSAF
jgi:hypothetical protein